MQNLTFSWVVQIFFKKNVSSGARASLHHTFWKENPKIIEIVELIQKLDVMNIVEVKFNL